MGLGPIELGVGMLHKRIGLIFSLASAVSLAFNIFTPDNPDHILNVVEQSCLVLVFALSCYAGFPFGGVMQIIALSVAAFLPMQINDSPFFGAVISVFALVLIYAYGGYRTAVWWKLPITFSTLFILCAIASSKFTPPSIEMYARAFMWALFIVVFCLVLWLIVADIEHRFHADFAARIIKQNRDLLELNKELSGGCKDGDSER